MRHLNRFEAPPPAGVDNRKYLPIAVDTLEPSDDLPFNLYRESDAGQEFLPYVNQHARLRPAQLKSLSESHVATLYIPFFDRHFYQAHLERLFLRSRELPAARAMSVIKAKARSIFCGSISDARLASTIHESRALAEQIADVMISNALTSDDLVRLMTHDYCTYTHATNVCVWCVVLARTMGFNAHGDLVAIAQGALLHDLGKRHIPYKIINKNGSLTRHERDLVEDHPRRGFLDVCEGHGLSWPQLMMIYQHHERPDGRGYPVGLSAEAIHSWAMLCSVADVFDAMTAVRPYHSSASPVQALENMVKQVGTQFDKETLQCFVKMMAL
jgi:HD-GYP domain-containing protein (c-di-GMP phosphodiesterase class II)